MHTADGHTTLVVYNALTNSETVLPHAKNGNLTTVSGGTTVLCNRDDDPFPANPGIHYYDLAGGFETLFPVLFPGEPEGQSNAWAAQASPNGLAILATKYPADSTAVYVVAQSGLMSARAESLVEVSKDVAWNYRWLLQPSGMMLPLVERLRYGSTRPDIYLFTGSSTVASFVRFHNSSFGFNVSLPEASPFNDLVYGDAHLAEHNHLLDDLTLADWDPDAPARRDEVAQILYNLMEVRGPLMPPPD